MLAPISPLKEGKIGGLGDLRGLDTLVKFLKKGVSKAKFTILLTI